MNDNPHFDMSPNFVELYYMTERCAKRNVNKYPEHIQNQYDALYKKLVRFREDIKHYNQFSCIMAIDVKRRTYGELEQRELELSAEYDRIQENIMIWKTQNL